MGKPSLDKDLKKVGHLEKATGSLAQSLAAPGLLAVFMAGSIVTASLALGDSSHTLLVVFAAVVAAYMALNVGANDVANNMGPAVGSRVLSMAGAIAIAAIAETAGAILAGGDVVNTVAKDLIVKDHGLATDSFIMVMMAALLAAGMWLHLATFLGAPVSTTHSIVGAVLGSGAMAAGVEAVNWAVIGKIAVSWVISPVCGGLIAAFLLGSVKWLVIFRDDRIMAAKRWVPILVALMAGVFSMYMASKGLSRIWKPDAITVLAFGVAFFVLGYAVSRPLVVRRATVIANTRKDVAGCFNVPLIFAVGLLSFAHGANDVANAVGPLAAIVSVAQTEAGVEAQVALPMWVLAIGALGISLGLTLFGPRLIRTVGEKITKMDPIRAYCVALSAAITVLVASAMGLPVSSTHVAIGAVFGVGYLREILTNKGVPNLAVKPRSVFLKPSHLNGTPEEAILNYAKREKRRLVRRQYVFGIAAAWVVTVPAAALLAAALYASMRWVTG
ncbi:inorganic phosphate transporter [Hyphomicrobium sp. CS1GBMeth3]|uniref:inorganic phosphate transporter n=1 Tax=Hyphomicrobium sp. CS1GBMeth3 TaxID=1892845 RepID=UPI000930FF8F|nr:inorganic phosphate transporter [Hyphomicrobium sp. CS1GBMeth3]